MEDPAPYNVGISMWENCQPLTVNRDHAIVITRTYAPGSWFHAGKAMLAPLHRKRKILLDRFNYLHAWTLYNDKIGTGGWLVGPDANTSLHFQLDIHTRKAGGWYFVIPEEIRRKRWLPECGGIVMHEWSESEINFWTESAYNDESVLQADST